MQQFGTKKSVLKKADIAILAESLSSAGSYQD